MTTIAEIYVCAQIAVLFVLIKCKYIKKPWALILMVFFCLDRLTKITKRVVGTQYLENENNNNDYTDNAIHSSCVIQNPASVH